jgi:hypothetical protein
MMKCVALLLCITVQTLKSRARGRSDRVYQQFGSSPRWVVPTSKRFIKHKSKYEIIQDTLLSSRMWRRVVWYQSFGGIWCLLLLVRRVIEKWSDIGNKDQQYNQYDVYVSSCKYYVCLCLAMSETVNNKQTMWNSKYCEQAYLIVISPPSRQRGRLRKTNQWLSGQRLKSGHWPQRGSTPRRTEKIQKQFRPNFNEVLATF